MKNDFTLHFRNAGVPFVVVELMFGKEAYGEFDYVLLFKNKLAEGYLSKRGISRAKEFGLKLLDNHMEVYNKMVELKKKLNDFSYSNWDDLKELLREFGKLYRHCEQPVLAGIEDLFITNCENPEECLQNLLKCKLNKKGKIALDILEKFGKMKYDLHLAIEKPLVSVFGVLKNIPGYFVMTEKEIDNALNNKLKKVDEGIGIVIADGKVQYNYDSWKKKIGDIQFGLKEISGRRASSGKASGKAKIFIDSMGFGKIPRGSIVVSGMTNPQLAPYLKNVAGIVTDEGGLTCHAAIIAREFKIPTVVGTEIATQVIKDGDLVEVDANRGIVKILERGKQENQGNANINYLNSADYRRMFRFDGQKYIHMDIFMNYYKKLDVIQLRTDKECIAYIPQSIINKTLDEGLGLLSNNKKTDDFIQEFDKYMKGFLRFINEEIKPNDDLDREIIKKFMEFAYRIFFYSSKTEFFYLDRAYMESKENKIIKNNLKKLYNFKERYRVNLMNKVFLGENCEFNLILKKLSNKFNIRYEDLFEYDFNEILLLYENRKVEDGIIKSRREAVAVIGKDGDIKTIIGKDAKNIIEKFTTDGNQNESEIYRGIVANPGKVIGKVKIILSDFNSYDLRHKEFDKMNKGDVLVSETTSPDLLPACKKAVAILADQGGLLSHAAVVSRELGIPCIVGLNNLTKVLHDGDLVEVDANRGIVKILERGK